MTDSNEITTTKAEFSDKEIETAKAGKTNVIVRIGVMGSTIAILNPASAEHALSRYREITGDEVTDGDTIWVLGFDDAFHTYEITAL